jgi:hypothetical protein
VRFTGKPPFLAGCIVIGITLLPLAIAVGFLRDPRSPLPVIVILGIVVLMLGAFSVMLFYARVLVEVSRDGIVVHERPFGGDKNGSYSPHRVIDVAWSTRTSAKGRVSHHVMLMLDDGRTIEPGFQIGNDGEATYVTERLRTAIRNAGGKC